MLLAEVARGGSDYCSLTDHNFAPLLQGLPDVVFAYEVGGALDTLDPRLRC